jgi:tetratricopeptide (TPR) repeat protein
MQAAQQALSGVHFSRNELHGFFGRVTFSRFRIDLLPVARRTAELYPNDPDSWVMWLDAARAHERESNWQRALEGYLEAVALQEALGVKIGRGTFEVGAGRIYQSRLDPRDLHSALRYYDRAVAGMDFLSQASKSAVYLYRGEVYQALIPAYSAQQALDEFERSLALDPQSYPAIRSIAIIYLREIKNYPLAHEYIDMAIGMNPEAAENYVLRGDIYRQQGSLAAAASAYQDAIARRPDWQVAVDRLAAVQAELHEAVP